MEYPVSNLLHGYSDYVELIISASPVLLSNDALPIQSVQPVADVKHAREDMNVFFAIGVTINIVMIIAFVIWARKEWKKHNTPKQ